MSYNVQLSFQCIGLKLKFKPLTSNFFFPKYQVAYLNTYQYDNSILKLIAQLIVPLLLFFSWTNLFIAVYWFVNFKIVFSEFTLFLMASCIPIWLIFQCKNNLFLPISFANIAERQIRTLNCSMIPSSN